MSRNMLHKNKLAEFSRWLTKQGFVIQPKPYPAYQILRIDPPDGSGIIVFYLRDCAVHITAPRGPAEELVEQWIRSKHKARSSSSPSPGGSPTCDDPSTTSPPWN